MNILRFVVFLFLGVATVFMTAFSVALFLGHLFVSGTFVTVATFFVLIVFFFVGGKSVDSDL